MQENKCFACEKVVQEDTGIKGTYICPNQRCIRFGLVSRVYLAPTSDTATTTTATSEAPVEPVIEDVTQEPVEDATVAE